MMRRLLTAASMALLAVGIAASAQPLPPAEATGPTCLSVYEVKTTKVLDPQTILFRMNNGKVWKNTLHDRCPGLIFNGFVYRTHDEQICANSQSIRVLVSRETCLLGNFTPYAPPA